MQYSYKPSGVCSRNITFEIEDGIVKNVQFTGGCSGNTQGLAVLCEGRKPEEIVKVLGKTNAEIVNTLVLDIINNSINKPYIKLSTS